MKDWMRWRIHHLGGLCFAILLFAFAGMVIYIANTPNLSCVECGRLSPFSFAVPAAIAGFLILLWTE